MARIAGVDIPREKRLVVSLTYIYGIGSPSAERICANTSIDEGLGKFVAWYRAYYGV